MRLFFTLVCCLAIPLVARAADQNNKTKKKQATQGQQQQHQQRSQQQQQRQPRTATQGKHHGANITAQLNNPAHVKGQKHPEALNAQNSNVPAVQSNSKGKVATKRDGVNTAAQLNNPAHVKGQKHPQVLNAQNSNVSAVQSSSRAKVESRHFNLSKSPSSTIQSATFNQNYRIHGSENWQGQQYAVFQNYRGEWHDQGWWQNHYNRIVLISGGWYFWNAGYWAPAWGYNSGAAYYPYNGPIYAYNDLPPDQVIANVQSTLQAQGYYRGEVDGFLGPITRAALANYQGDHGLYTTEAIDEPTLRSLGMS